MPVNVWVSTELLRLLRLVLGACAVTEKTGQVGCVMWGPCSSTQTKSYRTVYNKERKNAIFLYENHTKPQLASKVSVSAPLPTAAAMRVGSVTSQLLAIYLNISTFTLVLTELGSVMW